MFSQRTHHALRGCRGHGLTRPAVPLAGVLGAGLLAVLPATGQARAQTPLPGQMLPVPVGASGAGVLNEPGGGGKSAVPSPGGQSLAVSGGGPGAGPADATFGTAPAGIAPGAVTRFLEPPPEPPGTPVHVHMSFPSMKDIMSGRDWPRLTIAPAEGPTPTTPDCVEVGSIGDHCFTELQDAVEAAENGDTLTVTGTIPGTTTIPAGKELTIIGHNGATLNGEEQGSVLTISAGAHVTLQTLTITKGSGSYLGWGITDGGGIGNDGGTVTLKGTDVSGNTAAGTGGGIFTLGGTVILEDSHVNGNTANGGDGGGINNIGGTVTLYNSTVSGNRSSVSGGGISNNTSTLTLTGSKVSDNIAGGSGGGILGFQANITLNSSTVTGNTAAGVAGGIGNWAGTVTLNDSTVTDNEPDTCYGVPGC